MKHYRPPNPSGPPRFEALGLGVGGLALLALLAPVASGQTAADPGTKADELAWVESGPEGVLFHPIVSSGLALHVSLPNGEVISTDFEPGRAPSFELGPGSLDGVYSWELRELSSATEGRTLEEVMMEAPDVAVSRIQSGAFHVHQGTLAGPSGLGVESYEAATAFDQFIPGDTYIRGSLCVGYDCVNGEAFGYDTVRLKENNLRIHFEDTSTHAQFPSNDWRITVNDSVNGGLNRFSIDDASAGRVPFTIEAGARQHALYLDDYGRVGFGTSTPARGMHLVVGDTPTLRLDQSGAGGWPPQAWEFSANEVAFYLRDVTHGDAVPMRIEAGAPTHSLVIDGQGRLGLGTVTPEVPVDLRTADCNTVLKLTREGGSCGILSAGKQVFTVGSLDEHPLQLISGGDWKLKLYSDGHLAMKSGAAISAGGAWMTSCDESALQNVQSLTTDEAWRALGDLKPVRYQPKGLPGEKHLGFSTQSSGGTLMHGSNMCTMDVVAALTKVIQHQRHVLRVQQEELELITRRLDAVERLARGPRLARP